MAINLAGAKVAETSDKVTLATLVRGKNYSYFHKPETKYYKFRRNVPTVVPTEVADILELEVEEIGTDDGDVIDKEIFRIERNAEMRSSEDAPKRLRMKIVSVDTGDRPVTVARRASAPPGRQGLRSSR